MKRGNNYVNGGIKVGIHNILDSHPGMSHPTSKRSLDAPKATKVSIRNLSATGHAGIRNFGWGPGASRVIDMCRESGIRPPVFEEITGPTVVRFRVNVAGPQQVTLQVTAVIRIAAQGDQPGGAARAPVAGRPDSCHASVDPTG